jgi:tetratricopeptide (TPR) repeat protein
MKTLALLTGATIAAGLLAAPAAAGVQVVGNSVGYACYQAAEHSDSSKPALESCDFALKSGLLSHRDTVATHVNRGIVRINREDYQDAIRDFDRAIALDPDQPESYLNKGSALLRMGADAKLAIPLMTEALERKTRRPELAYFGRAIAHEVSGDIQSAYHDYKRAQQAAPEWKDPAQELSRFQVRPATGSRL